MKGLTTRCDTSKTSLPDGYRYLAVKKFDKKQDFDKERDMLNRLNGIFHEHLIALLTSYDVRNTFHLVFPFAEYNLDQYFHFNSEPQIKDGVSIDVEKIQWFSRQVFGIMEAMAFLHNARLMPEQTRPTEIKYGRHGDIKPENILWFASLDGSSNRESRKGVLVITDLGIGEFHSTKTRSNIPNKGISFTPDYRPPECDLKAGTVSRLWDIWTMGCLFLEMICWLLGGQAAREKFERERSSFFMYGENSKNMNVATFFDIQTVEDFVEESTEEYIIKVKDTVTEVRRCISFNIIKQSFRSLIQPHQDESFSVLTLFHVLKAN